MCKTMQSSKNNDYFITHGHYQRGNLFTSGVTYDTIQYDRRVKYRLTS